LILTHLQFATPQSLDFLHSIGNLPIITAFNHTPYYFTLPEATQLNAILRKPNRFFLEIGARDSLESALDAIFAADPSFALNVSTLSAYDGAFSDHVSMALERRFFIEPRLRMNIRTCLQEALANAIIHGNLALESPKASAKSFHYFLEAIHYRMAQDHFQALRICIMATCEEQYFTLSICDQGKGFPHHALSASPKSNALCGRGLFLIQSLANHVWIENDNKTLSMRFNL
jgi:anti-sigma regulatory factor (Ser/Thr protein kinase)